MVLLQQSLVILGVQNKGLGREVLLYNKQEIVIGELFISRVDCTTSKLLAHSFSWLRGHAFKKAIWNLF